MALKIKTAETKIVLLNLLLCVIIFYSVYYVVLCFCFTVSRLQMLDGLAPFDFKTKPSWINPYYLVLLVSLEITYFISGLLFVLIVEEWVWDYAITVTVIHITITSAVMAEFPLMLHWWAALGSGLISMICGGQCLAYYLFKDNFIYPVLDDF
ncbi:transmembrane protein 244 [Varanus komodoensis]|uniref:transmembrane protein 244 n=1 Tax=Varanus komodoensis TaxID=61221 RepID=UPI001CF7D7BC|nr:transmembrane protein 244 [Varanus komodoensis]